MFHKCGFIATSGTITGPRIKSSDRQTASTV